MQREVRNPKASTLLIFMLIVLNVKILQIYRRNQLQRERFMPTSMHTASLLTLFRVSLLKTNSQ